MRKTGPSFAQGYGGISASPPAKSAKKIICIVGTTSSGKTALGVYLAKKFGGEIISADSRQVFRKLDIGTNKDLSEYNGAKYHLIDVCEPGEEFTVFSWVKSARKIIEDIFKQGKLPIIVGGTGLYVQALLEGFEQKIASSKDQVVGKRYTREELDRKSIDKLQKIYSKLKIKNSKLDLQNPRRLVRKIERIQEGTYVLKKKPDFKALQIGIALPRPVLYEKIDKKVEQWFSDGIIEEVRGLLACGVSPSWLKKIGLNYRLISEYLLGNFKLATPPLAAQAYKILNSKSILNDEILKTEEFINLKQEIKWKTHAYARRQLTWFRRFPEIKWVKNSKEAEKLVDNFLKK